MKEFPLRAVNVYLVLVSGFGVASGLLTFDPFKPSTVSIIDSTQDITRLESIVNCRESDTSKICTCLVKDDIPYETWWLQGDSGYYVYYDNTARLSQGTTRVTVECKSNNEVATALSQTLTVQVNHNLPPVIQNYNKDSVLVDGKTTRQNDVVYKTVVNDPEDDAVIFNMTVNPNLGNFIIGTGNGFVYSTIDLRSSTVDKYVLTISATDLYNTVKDFVVTVTLNNRNAVPRISNLPTTVAVPENAKSGYSVITLTLDPLSTYVNMDPWCVTKNSTDMKRFNFDMPNNKISVAYDNAMDYEQAANITMTCTWCDGYLCDSKELLIVSSPINEAPVWSGNMFYCNIDEGNVGGPTCALNAVLKDPENDRITVDIVTTKNKKLFKYDYTNDVMSFIADYDLDQTGHDSDVTAIMTAKDSKGLTSTATVKIHVNDVNDNKCKTDSLQTFNLDESDQLRMLGSFPYSDADATAPNNDVHFEVASVSPSTSTNYITVTRNGEIYYTNLFSRAQGTINMKIIVNCVDDGSPRQTATATLLVNFIVPTTTFVVTTYRSTTTPKDIWSYPEFQATFGTLMTLVGLGLTVLLGGILAICCARKGWKSWNLPQLKKPGIDKVVPRLPKSPPTHRSLPPIENPQSVNNRWENFAWSQGDDRVREQLPPEGTGFFHYH